MPGFTERAILVEFELVDQHSWLLVFAPLRPLDTRQCSFPPFLSQTQKEARKYLFSNFSVYELLQYRCIWTHIRKRYTHMNTHRGTNKIKLVAQIFPDEWANEYDLVGRSDPRFLRRLYAPSNVSRINYSESKVEKSLK